MTAPTDISVSVLETYAADDAAAIGRLMPSLNPDFSAEPIAEDLLRSIIDSPTHDQLVARGTSGTIVGVATLSITMGAGAGRHAYLEDFVVDSTVRGAGIGSTLWSAILAWCREHGVSTLVFTSNPSRIAAHKFYYNHGAHTRDTDVFTVDI